MAAEMGAYKSEIVLLPTGCRYPAFGRITQLSQRCMCTCMVCFFKGKSDGLGVLPTHFGIYLHRVLAS